METLSHILASLDISRFFLSAFPQIFLPIVHAFESMFAMVTGVFGKLAGSHPGLISGTVAFFLMYVTWSGLSTLRHTLISARKTSPKGPVKP
ncbi:MAG: hypothetical protein NTW16_09245 [Bacteroidetes bacterium]|nr:hypothetical protein [Bacteroidota bacterium]